MVRARLAASVGPGGHVWGGSQPAPLPSSSRLLISPRSPPSLLSGHSWCVLQLWFFLCALLNSLGPTVLPLLLPASLLPCGTPNPS